MKQILLQRRRLEVWPGLSANRRVRWGSVGSDWKDTLVAGRVRWTRPWSAFRSCRAPWTSWTCGWLKQRRLKRPGSLWATCLSTPCRTTLTRPWWVRDTCADLYLYHSPRWVIFSTISVILLDFNILNRELSGWFADCWLSSKVNKVCTAKCDFLLFPDCFHEEPSIKSECAIMEPSLWCGFSHFTTFVLFSEIKIPPY